MKYTVIKDDKYDFIGSSYDNDGYPNLHKYPATMIPQVGGEILKELGIKKGRMLDPYCGSGSSFASGLNSGLFDFTGFDLNPLAIAISKARFTKISLKALHKANEILKEKVYYDLGNFSSNKKIDIPKFNNFDYWFSPKVAYELQVLQENLNNIKASSSIKSFCLVALSSTMRDCSYTRNNEFKLYRMKEDAVLIFNPDVFGLFFKTLGYMIDCYQEYCHNLNGIKISLHNKNFEHSTRDFDVVLTSPPYGDSRTTVAYGQFSIFSNEWLFGYKNARKLDKELMGGTIKQQNKTNGLIKDYIENINQEDNKRAKEVESFYDDLSVSISSVAKSIKRGGYSIYVVGNRTVKGICLPTDQFIAEQFEKQGLKHLITYERKISNKRMPKLNSPSNKAGVKMKTINSEFIVVCQN